MAEAFGVAAGIVGVLSLTIQITQVVVQFGVEWEQAPKDVKDFMLELQSLRTVLSETRTILEDPNFTKAFQDRPSVLQSELNTNIPTMKETKMSVDRCSAQLEKVLCGLNTRDKGHLLGWNRLKGPFLAKSTRDSVDKLRHYGQLINHMASIDAMTLTVKTWTEVKEMRQEQQKWHSNEENQAILRWISSLSFEERQRDILSKRHPETGTWLLDQEVFKKWHNGVHGEPSVLWCPGIAGAGKSVITSIVIEHLQQFFSKNDVSISYIFCDYKDRKTQTVVNLISSLVKQIVLQVEAMPREFKDLFTKHKNGQSSMSLEEYSTMLALLSSHFRRSFIIVDALDEHMISEDTEKLMQMNVLDILLDVQHKGNGTSGYTLLFTSRNIGWIQDRLAKYARIEISAAASDIELYLRSRIRDSSKFRFPVKVRDDANFIDQIVSTLVEKAQGMFLLPRLHLDQLECQTNVRDLRAALKSLPTRVDETYNDAMIRIQNQVPEYSKLAMSALSWISNALRPLKWYELQHALAIRRGDISIDEEALADETLLISVSAGLITLDAQSETIRLAHFTVEEYFRKEKQAWFPNADTQIAEISLIYLSFDVFKIGPCSFGDELETRLRQNCFLEYASQNWGHHTVRADGHIEEDLAIHFLTNDQMVSCCNQAKLYTASSLGVPRKVERLQSSGLHVAAQFGLCSVLKRLLERGQSGNSVDCRGHTPLTIAVLQRHVEMVKFLLGQENMSADSQDKYGRTPLSYAAFEGHIEIVKLLIVRDDVIADSRDKLNKTPLSYAALEGHMEIVKLLIARDDVIVDSRDIFSQTPLSHTASRGYTEIVKPLIARDDVIVDSRDEFGKTPLFYAASEGHTEIVKLLVARDDVVADSRDKVERTPLSYAAEEGHESVVKLLLDRDDVVADSQDDRGRTPLSYAAKGPLSYFADEGYKSVVRLLLDRGDVVADSRDIVGRTPLSYAAQEGYKSVVKLLLDRDDVVADSQDNNCRTPLSYAAEGPYTHVADEGYESVVKLLLDRDDVVADSQDNNCRTPLDYATMFARQGVIQLLENKLRTSRTENAAEVDY